ncbi:Phosphoacetylglucosamine mutase [Elsinoe australis]|uniref:Phosphoacetylglucosamine mutase n=1 Tax=Elsinoe australis TaxID=40998 RepID=A0A2P8A652_9PEZI|nr:Phosphoacetylglucosamine mutase [Elsinoe australis]
MPYNTRRKSLSLSELGVHVPKRARAPSQPSPLSESVESAEPPSKKVRCVPQFISPPGSMSPPKTTNIRIKTEDIKPIHIGAEHTPPPSPGAPGRSKVDTAGIKDEVVVGVIVQLEKTGNRPHTSKELAACLANTVPTIDSSTNPNALIQARLATYLKGPWPIVGPCPIGKQQENVHPRRVFYFLTSMPHQPIPDTSMQQAPRRIISPALSSSASDEIEEKYTRGRAQLSPSPEVDLSTPELDDDNDVDHESMYSSVGSLSRSLSSADLIHNRRAASPPLEREERDFKQTANELQQQRRDSQQRSRQASEAAVKVEQQDAEMTVEHVEESEESIAKRNREAAAALFGGHEHLAVHHPSYELSSPVLRPQIPAAGIDAKIAPMKTAEGKSMITAAIMSIEHNDSMDSWSDWDTKSPENIELDELECLFDAY